MNREAAIAASRFSAVRQRRLQPKQSVQQPREGGDVGVAVEQVRHTTEQVAEQVARTRLCGDRQVHLVQVDDQSEQVEVQWTKCQIKDPARWCRLRADERQVDRKVLPMTVPAAFLSVAV